MNAMYATITSKGQITLPIAARRALGLHEGQRVVVRVEDRSLVIDAPPDIDDLRRRNREAMEAAGTWGLVTKSGDGWAAHVKEKYGEPDHAQS